MDTDDVDVQSLPAPQAAAAPGCRRSSPGRSGGRRGMRNRGPPIYSDVVKGGFRPPHGLQQHVQRNRRPPPRSATSTRGTPRASSTPDMAYNFLVDRFGRVLVASRGMNRPVVGGHTAGLKMTRFRGLRHGQLRWVRPGRSADGRHRGIVSIDGLEVRPEQTRSRAARTP